MADSSSNEDDSDSEESTANSVIEKTSEHGATVACYVRNRKTGKVYGITNRHVTLHATGFVHIKTLDKRKIELGKPLNCIEITDCDIDLIEIKEDMQHLPTNQITNVHNKTTSECVYLFPGSFESIFEKRVFKYKPVHTCYEVSSFNTSNSGKILTGYEHLDLNVEQHGQFLVKSDSDTVEFSVEGESGTAVALDKVENSSIELLGIVCGGFKKYTVCLFLPFVLEYLGKAHDMDLELCSGGNEECVKYTNCNSVSVQQNDEIIKRKSIIPCGIAIFIICKTPEQIAPLNFNLLEYAFILIDYKYGDVDLLNHEDLLQKEQQLCVVVNQRGSVHDCSIFENDKPEYVAVEKGLLACDSLYEGNILNAENCLKQAIKCVCKSEDLGLRLFCKLITYITWFCLATNTTESLEQMQILLQEALECFQEHRKLTGFPKEVIGYLYYDYSRYYQRLYDNAVKDSRHDLRETCKINAVEKARLSAHEFQANYDQLNTPQTLRRVVLADSNLAYTLLGCGLDFNVTSDYISEDDIAEAEYALTHVRDKLDKAPLVQNVDYLLAKCDLHFRKGETRKALNTAQQCLSVLKGKGDQVSIHSATCRVQKLADMKAHH